MKCPQLDLEILQGDCINAQAEGHGYCRCCAQRNIAINRSTPPIKYFNFIFMLFKDAIDSHKTALHEIAKLRDKWGGRKQPYSKEYWRDLEAVTRLTQEILDAREWLTSKDMGVGSSGWVLENLSLCGIIENVDKPFFNVHVERFLNDRERNSSFNTVIRTPRRATQMSWLP